ncbi:MAG: zinc ribbon domain-containing protein [Treponema sp.]|jgi:putative FmdB family regulatory protein|nr:zinc ribbon domain-containing protein [Treponema sp.]
MPTYEYECKDCGHVFEAFQSMKDEPLKVCPECGKEIRRLITGGSGVIFKGAGFYITDTQAKPAAGGAAKDAAKNGSTDSATGAVGATAPTADKSGGAGTQKKELMADGRASGGGAAVEKKEAS